jgi:hypothetical protein
VQKQTLELEGQLSNLKDDQFYLPLSKAVASFISNDFEKNKTPNTNELIQENKFKPSKHNVLREGAAEKVLSNPEERGLMGELKKISKKENHFSFKP